MSGLLSIRCARFAKAREAEGQIEVLRTNFYVMSKRHQANLEGSIFIAETERQRQAKLTYLFSPAKWVQFGPSCSYGFINKEDYYTTSALCKLTYGQFTISMEGGSFMNAQRLPNAFAMFGLTHSI